MYDIQVLCGCLCLFENINVGFECGRTTCAYYTSECLRNTHVQCSELMYRVFCLPSSHTHAPQTLAAYSMRAVSNFIFPLRRNATGGVHRYL